MTKEPTMFLLAVAVSSASTLIQRWDHSVSPGHGNIGGMLTILPCHFHDKKTNFPEKTKEISNSTSKEVMTLPLELAASLTTLI